MRRPIVHLAGLAVVVTGMLSSFSASSPPRPVPAPVHATHDPADGSDHADDHDHADEAVAEEGRHTRAPIGVPLTVHEGAWLRGPDPDWFEAQAQVDPERFVWSDEYADGDGGYWDATGYYQLRYDETDEAWAYWHWVGPVQLTAGRRDFVQFCSSCHGLEGDGYGRSGQWLRPSPRDFRQGYFKFTKVTKALPTDEALVRVIRRGLDGTAMLPWALSDQQLHDIVQYIKYLSPPGEGWRSSFSGIGGIVEVTEDPWKGRNDDAVRAGEKIYHGKAQCMSCHPGYVHPSDLPALLGQPEGTQYREDLFRPVLKESNYTVLGEPVKILPPDFTFHTIRVGATTRDIFETIAAGIKGTAMPQWKGALPDKDLWALSHYVEDLISEYKDRPAARRGLMERLRAGL